VQIPVVSVRELSIQLAELAVVRRWGDQSEDKRSSLKEEPKKQQTYICEENDLAHLRKTERKRKEELQPAPIALERADQQASNQPTGLRDM
jgi:hypothetical protein